MASEESINADEAGLDEGDSLHGVPIDKESNQDLSVVSTTTTGISTPSCEVPMRFMSLSEQETGSNSSEDIDFDESDDLDDDLDDDDDVCSSSSSDHVILAHLGGECIPPSPHDQVVPVCESCSLSLAESVSSSLLNSKMTGESFLMVPSTGSSKRGGQQASKSKGAAPCKRQDKIFSSKQVKMIGHIGSNKGPKTAAKGHCAACEMRVKPSAPTEKRRPSAPRKRGGVVTSSKPINCPSCKKD